MEEGFLELINKLTKDFIATLPEDEDNGELVEAFKKYLSSMIINIQNSDSKFVIKNKEYTELCLKTDADRFTKLDIQGKKRVLIFDNSLQRIKEKSNEIFQMATQVLRGEKPECNKSDIQDRLNEMNDMLESVYDFNIEEAKRYIGDASLDGNYICSPEKGIMSLRLAHEMSSKKEEEER